MEDNIIKILVEAMRPTTLAAIVADCQRGPIMAEFEDDLLEAGWTIATYMEALSQLETIIRAELINCVGEAKAIEMLQEAG